MASPSENANSLIRYWQEAVNVSAEVKTIIGASEWTSRLYNATRAMDELVRQADQAVRREVFAPGSVFETCLTLEAAGVTELILAIPFWRDRIGDSPRKRMLDGIYRIATGGWWSPPTPAGMTEWVRSETVSAGAMSSTITTDPSPSVRSIASKLVQDVAIPRFWAEFFARQRTFESLEEQLKTAGWSWTDRIVLNSLATGAGARVQAELARYAMEALPTFPTGDGRAAATLPPRGKPPWRDARLLSATALGLITGGAVASKRTT